MSSWRKNRPVLTIQICHEKVTSRCRPVLTLDEACSPSGPGGRPCPVTPRPLQGQPHRGGHRRAQASAHVPTEDRQPAAGGALPKWEWGLPLRGYIPYLRRAVRVSGAGGRVREPGLGLRGPPCRGHPVGDALRPAGRWPEAGCPLAVHAA